MDWKLLVLAPVCLVFLAGCGGHSDDDSHPHSPYAGLWVNEDSVGVLNECEGGGFHNRGRVNFDAFRVREDGQVNRYAFGNSPRADENLGLGSVGNDGAFTRRYSAPGASSYGFNYIPTQEESIDSALQDGVVFMKDGNDKLLVLDNNGGSRVYIRGSDDDLRSRRASLLTCLGRYNMQYGQYQPNAYPQRFQDPRLNRGPLPAPNAQQGEPYYAYPPPAGATPAPTASQELPAAPPGQYQEYQR